MDTQKYTGLTAFEVQKRERAGQINQVKSKNKTKKQIILSHTVTYFNIMNLGLALLILLTGQVKNMLFMGVVISNSAIGIIQELRVKSLIDRLSVITALKARVIRDNVTLTIPVEQIVKDDILKLENGEQVSSDCIVLESIGLEVNESMLTGESKPVRKKVGDMLLSGSFVVAGNAICRVEHVGMDNYAVSLAEKAKTKKRASSEMQNSIKKIIQFISIAIIPVGLLLFYSQFQASDGNYNDAIVSTVGGVIGMIPEGLVLLTSISFILGIARLAKKRALVQEMEAIEALARVNILCTDKTGTITTGDLEVSDIIPYENTDETYITTVMNALVLASSDTNNTQKALKQCFTDASNWKAAQILPFSSERKYQGADFGIHGQYVLGAPDFLMNKDTSFYKEALRYSNEGYRVLLVGKLDACDPSITKTDNHEPFFSFENIKISDIMPLALILISDCIRTDAKATFLYFATQGVDVKVLSGDNPATVSNIAKQAGLPDADQYLDASTLPKNPEDYPDDILNYNIFGRIKPEQKQALIKAFQKKGNTVAMIGDGVNDVLAIKDADCGIAMAAGSDAAKQAAHIVLLDSDFASMKEIVKEGRTIISNIERVSALYLTKTIYSSLLSFIFILLQKEYPFEPLHLSLISATAIGIPSFFLALEQNDKVTSDGFLKHVLAISVPGAISMVINILFIQIFCSILHLDSTITYMYSLTTGGIVALLVLLRVCTPLSRFRSIILTGCVGIFSICILLLHKFFGIHSIFTKWALMLIPMGCLIIIVQYLTAKLMKHVSNLRERFR